MKRSPNHTQRVTSNAAHCNNNHSSNTKFVTSCNNIASIVSTDRNDNVETSLKITANTLDYNKGNNSFIL